MTLAQLLRLLRARKLLLIFVPILVFSAGLGASLLMPKTYVAEASLVADTKSTDPVTGNALPPQLLATYINTQTAIIASRGVALKVVDRYKLVSDPLLLADYQQATQGLTPIREWIADRLLGNLEIIPSRNSNVFQITYSSTDPGIAAELANAFADAYIRTSIELKLAPARRQSAWFDEQLVGLRQTLEAAQRKLSDFQKVNSLATTDGRLDVETAKLAGIAAEAVSAQAAMSDAQTRRAQLRDALARNRTEALPDILGNNLLQSMKADLVRKEAKLSDLGEHYGRNHPQFISAKAEVSTLREKLAAELETAKGAINQATEIAERRSTELQAALEAQKRKVLDLKQASDGRDVLTREVESAQRTYDAATQRGSAVRLESQLDQGIVSVLTPAIRPLLPARPRVVLNSVAALIFGILLGGGLAVIAELRDRRVRSGVDVEEVLGIALLAELPKLKRRKRALAGRKAVALLPKLNPA